MSFTEQGMSSEAVELSEVIEPPGKLENTLTDPGHWESLSGHELSSFAYIPIAELL
jgi:hypothetical protein